METETYVKKSVDKEIEIGEKIPNEFELAE